ncbi:unnamed protein product [Cunninghamella blakesleeana]
MANNVHSSGGSVTSSAKGSQSRNKYNRLDTQSERDLYSPPPPPKQYPPSRSATPTSQVRNDGNNYSSNNNHYDPYSVPPPSHYQQQQQYHHGRTSYEQHPPYSEDDYVPPFLPPSSQDLMTDHHQQNNKEVSSNEKSKFQLFKEKSGRVWLMIVFVFIIIVAIVWYFVWPRLFTLNFVSASLNTDTEYNWITLNNTNSTTDGTNNSNSPAGVTALWNITMQASNYDNWVTTQVQDLYMQVIDIGTGIKIGTGHSGSLVLPAKAFQNINFNVSIAYHPLKTDDTLRDLLNACYNQTNANNPNTQGLRVVLDITYYIKGIVQTSRTQNRINQLACPS